MIQIEEAEITHAIYHQVGQAEDAILLSEEQFDYSDEDIETLKKIFLKPFTPSLSTYVFSHAVDLELNPLLKFAKSIEKNNDFIQESKNIAQHLQSVSKHPNIKNGELFVLKFDKVKIEDDYFEAVGIYKVENKENYLETSNDSNSGGVKFRKGIGNKRLDKACLILFTNAPFTVLVIDNAKSETEYWYDEFIDVVLKKDHINNTNQFMDLTKSFITKTFPDEFEVSKTDQIDLLNRSVDYFKKNDTFEKNTFEEEVLQDKEVIKSFRTFDDLYQQQNDLEISDNFEISAQSVKKQARIFKSVLKLDKNFHIYIHGDKKLIEQGVESDGRKYYKLYYDDER